MAQIAQPVLPLPCEDDKQRATVSRGALRMSVSSAATENEINSKIVTKTGGKIDGPYLPQQHTVLYIFHVDKYERLNEAGRLFFAENAKMKLPFVPITYEVAVTPKEFFG